MPNSCRTRSTLFRTLAVLLLLLVSAGSVGAAGRATPPLLASAGSWALQENPCENFDPNSFANPTNVDNKWFPLRPGTQHVYEGSTEETTGQRIAHRVVFTVTDLTKVINGVRNVAIWELDYSDEQLAEEEIAFFAQADDGTVWHFGQYPEVIEEGKLIETPSWIAGVQDARPGITIKGGPQLGGPSYCQGWGPAVNWNDRAEVDQLGQETCVPAACYKDVLVTREFAVDEPNAFQLKYYAPGVGNVRVGWRGDDVTRETLELVSVAQLSPETMAEIRAKVLALEKRAYENSKDVYGTTAPLEVPAGAPVAEPAAPAGGDTPAPANLPRTGAEPTQPWPAGLLLALGLGIGAAGWLVRRRAARS
jgi:hypothetical protein